MERAIIVISGTQRGNMATFCGQYEETFTVDVSIDRAVAPFSNLDLIATNYGDIDTFEKLDDQTLRIRLIPRSALGATYAGEHVCHFQFGPRQVTWASDGNGNMRIKGFAKFTAINDNKTQITYHDEIACDIDTPRVLGKALQPIVRRNIERGVKGFLERMRRYL